MTWNVVAPGEHGVVAVKPATRAFSPSPLETPVFMIYLPPA